MYSNSTIENTAPEEEVYTSFCLSSSDVDYLNSQQPVPVDLLADTAQENVNIFASTCESKGGNSEGNNITVQNGSDQFVHFTSQGNLVEMTKPDINKKLEVCDPTVNAISSNTTNTSTSSILNQVAQMTLVDGLQYQKASTFQEINVQTLPNLYGTSVPTSSSNPPLVSIPVEVLTGTNKSSQMYVLSMTFDDKPANIQTTEVQEQVAQSILLLQDKEENLDMKEISKIEEPQRSSTPKFDDLNTGLNDTILDGNLAKDVAMKIDVPKADMKKEVTKPDVPDALKIKKQLPVAELQDALRDKEFGVVKQQGIQVSQKKSDYWKGKENLHQKILVKAQHQGQHKKQLCVADVLGLNANPFDCSTTSQNDRYCREWLK